MSLVSHIEIIEQDEKKIQPNLLNKLKELDNWRFNKNDNIQDQCNYYSIETSESLCLYSCQDHDNKKYHISGRRECITRCSGEFAFVKDNVCFKEAD